MGAWINEVSSRKQPICDCQKLQIRFDEPDEMSYSSFSFRIGESAIALIRLNARINELSVSGPKSKAGSQRNHRDHGLCCPVG